MAILDERRSHTRIDKRRRILITDTHEVSEMLSRHAREGEARSATLLRLANKGDRFSHSQDELLTFSSSGRTITSEDIAAALLDDDEAIVKMIRQ